MKSYDVVVLGAGPGGYVSAIRAAQLGASVAIVEKKYIGGTCLNVGCIPTKALIKNAEILHSIDSAKQRGIIVQGVETNFGKGIKAKDKAVKRLTKGVEGLLMSNGVDIYEGLGVVTNKKSIKISVNNGDEDEIEYKKLIVATGSRPAKPNIVGMELDGVVTSDELLNLSEVPEKLVIVGGGVIGCEMASIFSAYGSKVTVIEMMPTLVAMLDKDISENVEAILSTQGVKVLTGMSVEKIEKKEDDSFNLIVVNNEGNKIEVNGDTVLVSIGRKPNTEGLEILDLDMYRGFITVNDKMETSVENVYAIGDVTGKKQLAHVASEMGIIAAENALGNNMKMNFSMVPSCIYTIPEIGTIGISEAEAKEKGIEAIVGRFPLLASGKAVATGDEEGVFKIIADAKTKKILGAHLIGKSATELIAEVAAYIHMDATIDDVIGTIHAHPTISESLAEAARDAYGICIHMPKM